MIRYILYFVFCFFVFQFSGCAYFNTFYNTQKYFNQGLRELKRYERMSKKIKQPATSSRSAGTSSRVPRPRASSTAANTYFDQCIEKGSRLLELYPDSKWVDDTLYMLGRSLYYKGEYDGARKKFDELTTLFPECEYVIESYYWWGKTHVEQMSFVSAEEKFNIVLNSEISRDLRNKTILSLAEILYLQEKYSDAVDNYRDIVKNIDDDEVRIEAQLKVGSCYLHLEDYENAVESFSAARGYDGDKEQVFLANFQYAISKKYVGDNVEAIGVLEELLDDGKNVDHFPEIRIEMADCFRRQDNLEEAISIYQDVVNIYGGTEYSGQANYALGLIYYRDYLDLEKALDSFNQAQSARVQDPEFKKEVKRLIKDITDYNAIQESIKNEEKVDKKIKKEEEKDTLERNERLVRLEKMELINERAKRRYLLGEFYLSKVGKADSSLYYFNDVVELYDESDYAAKALLQIHEVYSKELREEEKGKKYLEELIEKYPQSDYSNAAREKLGLPTIVLLRDSLRSEMLRAEEYYYEKKELDKALEIYKQISEDYPEYEFTPRCIYARGRHYETEELDSEKAFKEYEILVEDYPETE